MKLSILLCVAALCCAGSALAADLDLQVLTDGPKFRRDLPWPEKSPIYDAAAKEVRLCGARNEVLGFQIFLRAKAGKISDVEVKASELSGKGQEAIAVQNLEFFRAWFVQVETPSFTGDIPGLGKGEYPDPLVPLNAPKYGAPFTLGGQTEIIFCDLYVPHGTPPGNYRGKVMLSSAGKPLAEVALQLTVWNFTLPEESHFKSLFAYDREFLKWGFRKPSDDDLRKIDEDLHQVAHRHRMNVVSDLYIRSSREEWEQWSQKYGKFLDGECFTRSPGKGVGEYCWRITFDPGAPEEQLREKLKLAVEYVEKKNWCDKFVVACFDEPKPDKYPLIKRVGQIVREATGGKLKHYLPGGRPQPEYQDCVDVWDGVWLAKDLPVLEERRKAGQRIWYCGGLGAVANPCIDAYPYGNRSWPWVGWKYDFEGFEMWHAIYWVDKFNLPKDQRKDMDRDPEQYLNVWKNPAPLTFDEGRKRGGQRREGDIHQNGSTSFFYPGYDVGLPKQCVASIKAKDFRRGAQDYEYLWLLDKAGEKKLIEEVMNRVYLPEAVNLKRGGIPAIKTGDLGVVCDESIWEAVHLELGKRLNQLGEKP